MSDDEVPATATPRTTILRQRIGRTWNKLESLFALLGVLASFLAIYHYGIKPLFERRAIDAAYRIRTIAEGSSAFDLKPFLRSDLADANKLVEVDVLVWNSGAQAIDAKEIRREVTMKFEQTSRVVQFRLGAIASNLKENFIFGQTDPLTYQLTWKILDPGDSFEVRFLTTTNTDRTEPVRIDGLIAGPVAVTTHDVAERNHNRTNTSLVITTAAFWCVGLSFVFVGLAFPPPRLVAYFRRKRHRRDEKVRLYSKHGEVNGDSFGTIWLFTMFGITCLIALVIGSAVSSRIYYVPNWLEPQTFPFFVREWLGG
jgi:hypothetical protein